MNYRKKYLLALLIAYGEIPNPRASIPALESSIKNTIVRASHGYDMDPEIPDSYHSILIPALSLRGLERESIVQFIQALNTVGSAGKASAGTILESAASIENESFLNNVGDVVGSLLHGDVLGAVGQGFDTIDDWLNNMGALLGG